MLNFQSHSVHDLFILSEIQNCQKFKPEKLFKTWSVAIISLSKWISIMSPSNYIKKVVIESNPVPKPSFYT